MKLGFKLFVFDHSNRVLKSLLSEVEFVLPTCESTKYNSKVHVLMLLFHNPTPVNVHTGVRYKYSLCELFAWEHKVFL